MLDFKPCRNGKHGWRNEYKWRKSKIYGFKSRRIKVDHYGGRHMSMRWGLNQYREDYRPWHCWARVDTEELTLFLARHLGEPVQDVLEEFLRRSDPIKKYIKRDGRIEAFKYMLGISSTYRRRYNYNTKGIEPCGWSGFGVDNEGKICYYGSLSYDPTWPGKMCLAKSHKTRKKYNKEALAKANIEPDESRVIGPIACLYVQRLVGQGREDIPVPRPVWLINTYRWDHQKKFKGWSKDLLYLKRYERVVPVGCETEYVVESKNLVRHYWVGPREGRRFYYYITLKEYEQDRETT